ncbi:MAG: hypothetical protein GX964_11050 [Syntrophomonadaceae bacterium]|nr:hypothetical protein [Syntrophomonadaceae bacterium]
METTKRQVILLSLIESMINSGSWCGETHIQKNMYFLQTMFKVPTEFDYILYKHGPFSFELRDSLGDMRGNMLVELSSRIPYGPSYRSSKTGKALIERYPKTAQLYKREIDFIARQFSDLGVADLERLATALYVTVEEGESTIEAQARKIHELKPHISESAAEQAIQEVEKLSLQYASISA